MLAVADVRHKANTFPEDKPVEELLDELVLAVQNKKGAAGSRRRQRA